MTEASVDDVLASLARQVGDLSVRLAVAEARLAAADREAVEKAAAQEAADDD